MLNYVSVKVGNATLEVYDSSVIKGEHVTIVPGKFVDRDHNGLATVNVILDKDRTSIRLNPTNCGDVTVLFHYAKGENTATVYIYNGKNTLEEVFSERVATIAVETLAGTVLNAIDVAYTPQLVGFARALIESATGFWNMLTTDMLIKALEQE